MKKLLALFLALTLALSGTALAYQPAEDTDPPLWQQWGYDSYEALIGQYDGITEEEYLEAVAQRKEYLAWAAEYRAAHPDEIAAFDANAWFEENFWYAGLGTWEEYCKEYNNYKDLDFTTAMVDDWLYGVYSAQQAQKELEEFIAAHPAEYAKFDPDQWLITGYNYYDYTEYPSRQAYKDALAATDEEFVRAMTQDWMSNLKGTLEDRAAAIAYAAAHPEAAAAFDADTYFVIDMGYLATDKPAYMKAWLLESEQDFYYDMLAQYSYVQARAQGYQDEWAAMQAAEPERTAQFLTELPGWLMENYYLYSLEDYLAEYSWYDCAEAAYIDLYSEWNADYAAEQELIARRNAFITERGGVPGALGVMLDGKYLTFPEGRAPYTKDRVIYADAATLSTALGIDIPAPIDGFVSVRSAAEKAGCKVYWDGEYQSAVLLNVKALSAQIDKDFTIINGALGKWETDLTKNYKSGTKLKADVTIFDSFDGNKTGNMTYDMDLLFSAKGLQMTGKYDMSKLLSLLLTTIEDNEFGPGEELLAQIRALAKGDFEIRMDFEKAIMYMKASALEWLYEQESLSDEDIPAGSWLSTPLAGMALSATADAPALTYGGLVCTSIAPMEGYLPAATLYDSILEENARVKDVLGDGCFVQEGQNYKLTLDLDDYAALTGQDPDDYYGAPKQFDLTLTIRPDGGVSGKLAYEPYSYSYLGSPATRITADFNLSLQSQKLTMEIHAKNTYKVVVDMTGSTAITTTAPELAPPKGANVVEY